MKLYSQVLELKALRSITDPKGSDKKLIASFLMARLGADHFYYEPARAAFVRLQKMAAKRGRILTFTELAEDPGLSEEFRDIIKTERKKAVLTQSEASSLFESLDRYRKVRALFDMSRATVEVLKGKEVDVDKLLDECSTRLAQARASFSEDPLLTVGHEANALDLLKEALNDDEDVLLKTGYKEFDDKNGGLPREGVTILASTTSGGKSTMRMNLMKQLYLLNNISVSTVSLEMNKKKETRRLLSNLTSIPFWKFNKKALTKAERRLCKEKWLEFHRHGKANRCRYSLMCPTRSVSMEQALTLMQPYGYGVIAIDYVGLLDGMDGDNMWRALGAAVRTAKIFSAENHCLVIILCQLDSEDDRIRYSKGMLEHADNAWIWNYSKPEQRETHVLPVKQVKARDAELFPFDLREAFAVMQILNMDDVSEEADRAVQDSESAFETDEDVVA